MRKTLFAAITFVFFSVSTDAQQNKIDSLRGLLKTDKPDTNKVFHLARLSRAYDNTGSYDSAVLYANSALELVKSILANAPDERTKLRASIGEAAAYNSLGICYADQGNYPEALKNHFASLKINEALGEKSGIAASRNNIGLVYLDQDNYNEALKNYAACLKLYQELGNKKGIAASYSNMGLVYAHQLKYAESLKNHRAALEMRKAMKDVKGLTYSYNNLGLIYYQLGNYEEALKNHFLSLHLKDSIGDKAGIAGSYCNIGQVLTSMKKHKEAATYLNKAKELSQKIGMMDFLKNTYTALFKLDSAQGDFRSAFEHHKLYLLCRDSMDNKETRAKTIQSQLNYEFEKKTALLKAEQDKKEALQQSEARRQKVLLWSVIGGLLLVLGFAVFISRALRISRRQKEIIERQKDLVDAKQKEILDSIHYAKRIQMALITGEKYIERTLKKLKQ